MFYQFSDELKTIDYDKVNPKHVCAGYVTLKEFEQIYQYFGFSESTVRQCEEENRYFRSSIEVYDDYSFGTLRITDAADVKSHEDCIAFYVKKNLFLIVDVDDCDNSTKNKFAEAIRRFSVQSITLEKLIYAFLESLITGDNKVLEDLEYEINLLEEFVLSDRSGKDFNMELLHKKQDLVILRNYYEQLIDIGDELSENENELFFEEDLRYFKIFTDKAVRLRENVDMLRDTLVHLRDAYQSYLDLKMNQTMKVFTVVSAIFLPLTVIVGWYGMNFKSMPEYSWKYGYVFVITLSVVIALILTFLFKKKKWF